MTLWRISHHAALDGAGGLYSSARWHSRGRRIVYCAESPPGALIEILVNLELRPESLPRVYGLIKVEAADGTSSERVDVAELDDGWQQNIPGTTRVGNSWLARTSSALLAVPSAIMPETSNWLINPEHPHMQKLSIQWHRPFLLDKRLLRTG